MKTLIFFTAVSAFLLSAGCSTTSYLSLTENNKEQIKDKLKYDEIDENVGAEITLSIKNGEEINGELLSVRDSTLTICTEHSATEEELTNLTYPINTVRNDEIQELAIVGGFYVWSGVGYGALGGAALGAIIGYATWTEGKGRYFTEGIFSRSGSTVGGLLFGSLVGAIAGGVVGYILSTDDVILQEIPPGYDFSLLKPLARYPDEEPEYLKSIK